MPKRVEGQRNTRRAAATPRDGQSHGIGCLLTAIVLGSALERVGLLALWLLTVLGGHPWGIAVYGTRVLAGICAFIVLPLSTWGHIWGRLEPDGISGSAVLFPLVLDIAPYLLVIKTLVVRQSFRRDV